MEGKPRKKSKDRSKIIFAVVLLLFAIVLIYYSLPDESSEPPGKPQISAYSPKVQELVNRHLQITQKKIQLRKQQAGVNLRPPEVGSQVIPSESNMPLDSEDSNIPNQEVGKSVVPSTPDSVIQGELKTQAEREEYDRAYREAYAKQFVENARKNGWEVTLNDQYVVVKVRPLSKKQPFKLFEPSGEGAR